MSFKRSIGDRYFLKSIIVTTVLLSAHSFGEPNKLAYELQEKCGKSVSDEFRREFRNGVSNDKTTTTNYRSHYNSKLNSCIYLQMASGVNGKGEDQAIFFSSRLFDFNENFEIGNYYKRGNTIISCSVDDKKCNSKEEYDLLIKPYLMD